MVLIYPGALPSGALVRLTDGQKASPALSPVAEVWLDASTGVTLSGEGRAVGWTSRGPSAVRAMPVSGNPTGTDYLSDPPALHFVAGENGGFRLSDAIADGAGLSFGLIVTPDLPEARTLMSLQPLDHEDYVFLSLEGMALRLMRRGSDTTLTLNLPPDTRVPLLILCALTGGMARMAVNGGPAVSGPLLAERGPADLFIGCRNDRKGMKNKLGGFDLSDVLVWPGQDVLAAPGGLASVTALWDDRCSRGI